jgi:Na+/proline symporter
MKTVLNISKIINILALCCLIGLAYGLILTGILQVLAAILFFIVFPKEKLIYIYFGIVGLFFLIWEGNPFGWQFGVILGLMILLTYTIHTKKI